MSLLLTKPLFLQIPTQNPLHRVPPASVRLALRRHPPASVRLALRRLPPASIRSAIGSIAFDDPPPAMRLRLIGPVLVPPRLLKPPPSTPPPPPPSPSTLPPASVRCKDSEIGSIALDPPPLIGSGGFPPNLPPDDGSSATPTPSTPPSGWKLFLIMYLIACVLFQVFAKNPKYAAKEVIVTTEPKKGD